MVNWDTYRYMTPVLDELTRQFGTTFELYNTGGGCICGMALLEGGYQILVGSGVDGPLLRDYERDMPHGGGFGVGVYDESAPWTGRTLAYAVDQRAETADDIAGLIRMALQLVQRATPESYVTRTTDRYGNVSEKVYRTYLTDRTTGVR